MTTGANEQGGRPKIGIIVGDGAYGTHVRQQRLAQRAAAWADTVVHPVGGEFRRRYRDWTAELRRWLCAERPTVVVDDGALSGVLAAKAERLPCVAVLPVHPIWSNTFGDTSFVYGLAEERVVCAFEDIGVSGIGSLGALARAVHRVGPIFDESWTFGEVARRPANPRPVLLVTMGSAKYDRTPEVVARQAARYLPDWDIVLHGGRNLGELPANCTVLGFVPDFRELVVGADAVLCAGGHTALEAIHLGHRPIVLPVSWQKEQRWLADQLAETGLGWSVDAAVPAARLADLVREAGNSAGRVVDRPGAERALSSGLAELDAIVRRTAEGTR